MRTITVTFHYQTPSEESTHETELNQDTTLQDVLQEIADKQNEELQEAGSEDVCFPDNVEITGVECEKTKTHKDIDKIFEFAEAYCQNNQDGDVIDAALYCGVSPSDIDEAYSGEFSSDENFARDMADQLGAIDKSATWPQNCIDWEYAAKELMYDYCEHNGHYFRKRIKKHCLGNSKGRDQCRKKHSNRPFFIP